MSDTDSNSAEPNVETDERFPSGEWKGFWLQRSWQPGRRGWMKLRLAFSNGVLQGEGHDLFGDFTIRGNYDVKEGEVTFIKKYATYDVFYMSTPSRNYVKAADPKMGLLRLRLLRALQPTCLLPVLFPCSSCQGTHRRSPASATTDVGFIRPAIRLRCQRQFQIGWFLRFSHRR